MDHSIHVREADPADLETIIAIYNATIPGRMVTADTEPVSIQDRLPWFHAHQADPSRPLWVAEYNGEVCGWLSISSFYGRPAYQTTVEVSIYLDARYQRKGIGSFLIQYALSRCPDLGIKTIMAFIFGQNQPSLRLFKHFGFQRWGICPKVAELDGVACDLVIMGKHITGRS
ncbi:N-acetyltransferase family protein [Sporolactobacillus sp. CPB3-1]|uniref:N-acetyltransferase family protein n=1 Tax=Sporolactobacillus mangiferae TaxID=2940498 RepID=A0ABT0MCU5_9BACL|nr:GNAT family N-acetyltransferase [Sporolactobacillus mangiferae]MCL1632074.1 N-acetyltransferase family protein [Sporolactobacillus mangiferae]